MSTDRPAPFFPLLHFTSLLGVHTILLLFVALYLPRSTFLFSPIPPQASSRDKPQHPFLRALTADPSLTLLWLCLGTAAVQASWASRVKAEVDNARILLFGEDEEARVKRALESGREKFQSLKDAVISTLACSIFIHIVLVLFGAPNFEHFIKTFLLALLLSLLMVYPSVYTLKPPSLASKALVHRMMWIRLFAELSPRTSHERLLVYPVVGAALGAWIGVFPIALDWDRPWQAWPLTPAYGAIFGLIIASWTAIIYISIFALAGVDKSAEAEKARAEVSAPTSTASKKGGTKKAGKRLK
ncbi:GPI11 [Sanghuangporus vaninii]